MEYNSTRPRMIIPEYGRNIQKMVDYAVGIQDPEERNRCAKAIIKVMGELNPHLRDVTDFHHKLWDHLFIISDFKLEVESPYPIPSKEEILAKPNKLEYPHQRIRYKHYGSVVQKFIEKARGMEKGPERDAFTCAIANLMKKAYLTYNRDSVDDEVIIDHLTELSKGELVLPEGFEISATADTKPRNNQGGGKKGRNNQFGKRNGFNKNNNNYKGNKYRKKR